MQFFRNAEQTVLQLRAWTFAALLAGVLLAPALGRTAEGAPVAPQVPTEFKVGPGDSWNHIRGRACPLEAIQAANPALASRNLRPGDVIRSPFVLGSELEKQHAQISELQGRLHDELERRGPLEARVAAFETLQGELTAAREAEASAKHTSAALLAAAAVGFALFLIALVFTLAVRQESDRLNRRLSEADERYADLRRSLQSLEVNLQKRMLELLGVHKARGGQTPSDADLASATLPVIELAERLKRRHAS